MDELQIAAVFFLQICPRRRTKDSELYRSEFTDDAYIDYSVGGRCGRASPTRSSDGSSRISGVIRGACTTSPTSKRYRTRDTAQVRAMFYNPMQVPGMAEMSSCGGYYHHELVRTPDRWRSRHLREENVWVVNSPAPLQKHTCEIARVASDNTRVSDVPVTVRRWRPGIY